MCVNFLPSNSIVFIDNYFNSLSLLDTLKEKKLYCVGTIRSDRIEKAPLKELKKEKRGSHFTLHDPEANITLIRWHDNSQVTLATNLEDETICKTKVSCRRWSKQDHASVSVDQPTAINFYNKGMGGVDRFDQMRGLYRSRIRSKKWYWPLFRFCLNGAVVNMWYLYRRCDESISLVEFLRRIVLAILVSPPLGSVTGPQPKRTSGVMSEIRHDMKEHWIDKQQTQRRCAKCGKCSKFVCLKCNVGLHPDTCFRLYHQK
ncbi:Transposase IS4 [Popillia japonica]|uniref:Transposase IS4 n=1 Tax=Popillia japonica TaxID=7064 RepID=A0AAW1LZK5_POPJA